MAAHPIAEASITLYRSLPPSLSDRGQSAGQSSGQSGERARAKENEEEEKGDSLPPPPLAPTMLCNCCKQTDRVTEGLTHVWTSVLLRTLAVILHCLVTNQDLQPHPRTRGCDLRPSSSSPHVSISAGRASFNCCIGLRACSVAFECHVQS